MRRTLVFCWLSVALLVMASPAWASLPPRPVGDEANNFYIFLGVDNLDYRLDLRGATGFAAAGLDVRTVEDQGMIGVGWVLARPVRLDLVAGGGIVDVDREGVDCSLGRASVDLHLAVAENRWLSVEGTLSMGVHALIYEGLVEDEAIPGLEVGVGSTVRLNLPGPLGLMTTYRWSQARFHRANIELDDETVLRVHPTAAFHSVRMLLTIDL